MRLKYLFGILMIAVCATCAAAMTIDEEIAAAGRSRQARKALEERAVAMLEGDGGWEEKDRACRFLRVVGSTESVNALAQLLPNEKLSHMARYALEPMTCPEAAKALRDAVGRTSGMTKVGIIHSIGVRRDKEAMPLLSDLLKDSDSDVAGVAAWALGRMGTPETARALVRLGRNAPAELQSTLLDALLTVADELVRQGEPGDALTIYQQLHGGAENNHVRMSAVVGLLQAQPDKAADRLLALMSDKDAQMRSFAIAKTITLKDPKAGERFAAELPKLAPSLQVLLIDALAQRNERVVRDAITSAAASDDEDVRAAAAKALGDIGDASSVPVLAGLVARGGDGADAQAAAASLRRLKADGVTGMIVKLMQISRSTVVVEMIEVLNDRNASDAAGAILTVACVTDDGVRAAALKALANLAGPERLPDLVELLVELDGDAVRKEAERAVVSVSLKIEDEGKRSGAALKVLASAKDTATRCSLLRVLGGIATKEALVEAVAAVKDKDAVVEDAAIRVLAAWPNPAAAEQLVELYSVARNAVHRTILLRGCVRLLGMGEFGEDEMVGACRKLMQGVKTSQEKKLVLALLANVGSPRAAEMVEPLIDDNEVKAEAELAMLGIAKAMAEKYPDQARATAQELIKKSTNDTIRKQAQAVIRQIKNVKGG